MISETSKCPICGSAGQFHKDYSASNFIFTGRAIHSCLNCGFFYVHKMPSCIELEEFNSSYWDNAHSYSASSSYDNPWFQLLANLRHKYLEDYINLNGLSILEIGPGEGYLAKRILSKHNNLSYHVIESDSTVANVLKTMPLKVFSDFSSLPPNQKYDLVIASHVLEHVSHPKGFISSIQSFVRSSGLIFIEVPCLDFLYKPFHDPHLLFFDKPSLGYLLKDNSFEILDLSYSGQEIASPQKSIIQSVTYRLLRKLLQFNRIFGVFIPNIDSLSVLDTDFQKLISLYHSCHVQSMNPSHWLRVIATNSQK